MGNAKTAGRSSSIPLYRSVSSSLAVRPRSHGAPRQRGAITLRIWDVERVLVANRALHRARGTLKKGPLGRSKEVLGSSIEALGLSMDAPGIVHGSPGIVHRSPGFVHRSLGFVHGSPGIVHRSPGVVHRSLGIVPGLLWTIPGSPVNGLLC